MNRILAAVWIDWLEPTLFITACALLGIALGLPIGLALACLAG
jgi:hypothetical protein